MNNLKIFALGGLDEDGKNMTCVETDDALFVIEAGLKYPENESLGIEMIIPDMRYLVEHKDKLKGIFITHGHDDVMAAIPTLIKMVNVPIYTAPLTAMILEKALKKEGVKNAKIQRVQRNATFEVAGYTVRTFGVTQSIADGFGVAIQVPQGYVVYTSEFIVDYDTKDSAFKCDIDNLTDLSRQGVFLLMSESVAATREGHSAPHHRITDLIEPYFEEATNRMVLTIYDQNLYRVLEVIELASKYNRKIMFHDEELRDLMREVEKLGYYHIPMGLEIPKSKFDNAMEDVLVIISGSGSNIFKRVHKIATKEDEILELRPTDTVIIASPAVPGTEKEAARMENDLYKEAGKIITVDGKRMYSMHAAKEDLKMMLYLLKPKYYLPVKGEYRKLITNANIALDMGFAADHILVLDNGQIAKFEGDQLVDNKEFLKLEDVNVDGNDSLDSGGMVLKDRELLSTDGCVIVGVVINHITKKIIGGPDVQSRGVIYLRDADYLVKEIGSIMEKTILDAVKNKSYENMQCRMDARDKIAKYIFKETGKKPMILPAIIEINAPEQ